MKENVRERLEVGLRRAAVTLVAIAAMAAGTVHASPPGPVVAAQPTDLPALARQTGDTMLLHETFDGRIMPDIEQYRSARLATFDLTDPLHIKGESSVYLDASGPSYFEDAVSGLTLPFPTTDALTVTQLTMDASHALDFGVMDPVITYELSRMFDVKQVRAQMTRTDTGASFISTKGGLHVIRPPAVDWIHQSMEIPPN